MIPDEVQRQINTLMQRISNLENDMAMVRDGAIVGMGTGVDMIDGIHASTTATANKLLALDASAELPTSITGDADTVDDKHATDLCGVINWLATTVLLTGGTDYTTDGAWTDLDLTAHTSANARYVFLMLVHNDTCAEADLLGVRENGKTPDQYPFIKTPIAAKKIGGFVLVKMDTGQVIEYYATDASDTNIEILGYIE